MVLGAKDAHAALDLLDQQELDFSLAIIDIFMPLGGGLDLIAKLSAHKTKLKIIAISVGRQAVFDKAFSLGADAGVKKPPAGAPLDHQQWIHEVFLQIGLPDWNAPDRPI